MEQSLIPANSGWIAISHEISLSKVPSSELYVVKKILNADLDAARNLLV